MLEEENKQKNQNSTQNSRNEEIFSWKKNQKKGFDLKKKFENFKLFLIVNGSKAKIFLKDHWQLLIKSSAENHLRIQECKNIKEGQACNLEFGSYSELKRYQKKVRLFTYSFSSTVASLIIVGLFLQIFLPSFQARGAVLYFEQTGWTANPTTGTYAINPGDQNKFSGWESKDAGVQINNPATSIRPVFSPSSNLTLDTISGTNSITKTSNTDFAGGTNNMTGVVGTGNSAYIASCEIDHGGANWEPIDNAPDPVTGIVYDSNPAIGTIEITGIHCGISNFTIASGKTVFVKAYNGTSYGNVSISATNSTILGTLSATGRGYLGVVGAPGQGPGGGGIGDSVSKGGSYGGVGGAYYYSTLPALTYGSPTSPNRLGSAGGGYSATAGGSGGGYIRIVVSNTLTVNGSISSNGSSGGAYTGGGSGGSIWISANIIANSTGTIQAIGGAGTNSRGWGGGGRIAIDSVSSMGLPNANISAPGMGGPTGSGNSGSWPGTVYLNGTQIAFADNGIFFTDNESQAISNTKNERGKVSLVEVVTFLFGIPTAKAATADFTSASIDTGYSVTYKNTSDLAIAFDADANIKFQIATNNDNLTWKFVGPNDNTGGYYTTSSQSITSEHNDKRYLKYKVFFTFGAGEELHFNSITFNYNTVKYKTNQSLISSWYKTNDDDNFLTNILWKENLDITGKNIKFQVQTAQNNENGPGSEDDTPKVVAFNDNGTPDDTSDDTKASPTGFMGPDGTVNSFYVSSNCTKIGQDVNCPISAADDGAGDGKNDHWMQYKLTLDSDGAFTPQVDQVKMQYVGNITPQILNMTASQLNTGIINIGYDVIDGDSSSSDIYFGVDVGAKVFDDTLSAGATTIKLSGTYVNLPTGGQTIQIDQEQIFCESRSSDTLNCATRDDPEFRNYTRKVSHKKNATVWFIGTSGDVGNTTGAGADLPNDTGKVGTWDIKKDLPGIYVQNARLRVVANDKAPANQVSSEQNAVASFELDTKDPIFKSANASNRTYPLIIDRISNRADTKNARLTIQKPDSQENPEDIAFDLYIKQIPTAGIGSDCATEVTDDDKYEGSPFAKGTKFNIPNPNTGVVGMDFYLTIPPTNKDPRKICVRIKDLKGNVADSEIVTPIPPDNDVKYYDFSQIDADNSLNSTFKELVVWSVYDNTKGDFKKYEVYRASLPKGGDDGVDKNPDTVPALEDFVKLNHPEATIENIDSNYFFDRFTDITSNEDITSLRNMDKYYFYKVVVTDKNGDVSALSAPRVADVPNGQGGSDTKAPEIKNSAITTKDVSWAQMDLSLDEIASAQVYYKKGSSLVNPEDFYPLLNDLNGNEVHSIADPSYVENHKIVMDGLNKNSDYNVLIQVTDPSKNKTEKVISFKSNDGPQIGNVTFDRNSNTEATIFWTTDVGYGGAEGSTSKVVYSPIKDADGLPANAASPPEDLDKTKTHRVTIKNLTPGVRYFFSVSSSYLDTNGNKLMTAIDNNAGKFHEILTTTDSDAPIITNIETPLISYDTAAIQWLTDPQPSVGKVLYWKTINAPGEANEANPLETTESFTYDASHYVIIPGLEADKEYTFKIYARNINGNENTVDKFDSGLNKDKTLKFKTEKDPRFNHLPLSKIENIDAEKNKSDKSAVITFTTDQIALCHADLDAIVTNGTTTTATANTVFENGYVGDTNYNTSHAILLTGLVPATEYSYVLTCHDNVVRVGNENAEKKTDKFENWANTSVLKFETLKELYTAEGAGALLDKNSPLISNVKVASTTGESATITWDSDEKANSVVRYGSLDIAESGAIDSTVNSSVANFATAHTVTINGLVPGTKYVFVASSTDASGNIGQSAESSFTTASPSSLSSIKAESKNLGEAVITWNTSSETSSIVEYGLTTSYGEKKESSTQAKEHSVSLSNLNQGVTYHFRVKGKDADGKLYSSSDQTFEPKSPPQISNIVANDINEHEATISFETNVPTTAIVNYTNIQDQADNGSQANNEMATKHSIQIKNLTQGATFKIKVQARDEQGTESSEDAKDLTTGKDENPPKIDMVKTDLALAQNDKVQAIISWTTDEQATTSVIYKEGRNAEPKEIKVSDALTPAHIAVITAFKPGTVYYFNTKSVDASGNTALSTDYALLTPKRKENIIQIIIGNFTDIFGWAKF